MGGGGGYGGGGMGGSGGAETSDNQPAAVVRWESAPLVRDAETRSESKEFNDAVAGFAKDYYVVSVSSMGAERRGGWGGGQGGPGGGEGGWGGQNADQTPEQVETRRKAMDARLIAVTSLTRAGQPIAPERVESLKGFEGRVRLFLFPRSLALDKSTEELAFQTALGPMAIKTKFNLKDMSQSSEPGL
ncbi:MAG: hypothetical protein ABSE21_05265, partial [Bryobacteraceae bacterium]